jgi:hypothetical protein
MAPGPEEAGNEADENQQARLEGGKVVTIPLVPRTARAMTWRSASAREMCHAARFPVDCLSRRPLWRRC